MNIMSVTQSQRTAASVAAVSYLLGTVTVIFSNYGLLIPLFRGGSPAKTAQNILAHELQFRIGLTGCLVYSLVTIVLLVALYLVLEPVNRGLALAAAAFRLVFAILWLMATLHLLGALRLLGSAPYLRAIEPERLQALARVTLAATFDDYYVGLPFFGLAATVSAYLWFKSRYVPRWLGLFGLVASGWCVICAFCFLVIPKFGKMVNPYIFDVPMEMFELTLSIWLLVRGLTPSDQARSQVRST